MKSQSLLRTHGWNAAFGPPFFSWSLIGFLLLFHASRALAGGIVTNCTDVALRAAMTGGGTVTFACDGTIMLTNTIVVASDTLLDSSGRQITISGNNVMRVFYVNTNVTFTARALSVVNGYATNGAGLFNSGGTVNLQQCVFSGNRASGRSGFDGVGNGVSGGDGTTGAGGVIVNSGNLTANYCSFINNFAVGGGGGIGANGVRAGNSGPGSGDNGGWGGTGGDGLGGALYNAGNATLVNCTLAQNGGTGGAGNSGGPGGGNYSGGGIYFGGNGGSGGSGGRGLGAAIYNSGTIALTGCTLASNNCAGAAGGFAGSGGYVVVGYAGSGGYGGFGREGLGSGLYNVGTARLVNCTLAFNSGTGAAGGGGGGGGWYGSTGQGGNGGNGGNGGDASGAIYDSSGLLALTNCTIVGSSSISGLAGFGGGGGSGPPTPHPGANGAAGSPGSAYGGVHTSGGFLMNTLLATNIANTNSSRNGSGSITDGGHNLSSDGTCLFTNVGSRENTDPKLGPLANNGGQTLTISLLLGSPAIDAGDTSAAPSTDQRGFPRAALAPDIGAFEYGSMLPVLSITRPSLNILNVTVQGNSNQWCRLLASSNLAGWTPLATNQIGPAGMVSFQDTWNPDLSSRFYRVVMP